MRPMITHNTDGTYTVGYIKCRSMEAAQALLSDVGSLVDPLTITANGDTPLWICYDPPSR